MQARLRAALLPLLLWAAVMFLSWCVTLPLPAAASWRAWFLPSPEIVVLLALFALFAPRPDWRLPRPLVQTLCLSLLVLRLGRIADGICLRYLDRRFHAAADLTLIPEFARLGLSTLGKLGFALALAGLCAGVLLLWMLSAALLRWLARVLSERAVGNVYLGSVVALAFVGTLLVPHGLFASSISPRLLSELDVWLTTHGMFDNPERAAERREFNQLFQDRQALLRAAPTQLGRTGNVDVHVLLVEAYGRAVQSNKLFAEYLAPTYQRLADALAERKFSTCSMLVRATVFGGNSWMTHATLQSATPVRDQFEYSVLMERASMASLAQAFRHAGYRAVSVKPGTTRSAPFTRLYGFDREYAAADLGYRGPAYAWAPMPDQFVLQRIADLELRAPTQPLFLEYALVSSHFPFDPHPPYIPDWSEIGDGSIYHQRLPVSINELGGAKQMSDLIFAYAYGYVSSLSYDLTVIGDYVTHYVRDDGLVLVLGDHQPIAPVAGDDRSRATPLHVISRRDALLDPFRALGCEPGLHPRVVEPQLSMEDLGIELLRGLSGESGAAR